MLPTHPVITFKGHWRFVLCKSQNFYVYSISKPDILEKVEKQIENK